MFQRSEIRLHEKNNLLASKTFKYLGRSMYLIHNPVIRQRTMIVSRPKSMQQCKSCTQTLQVPVKPRARAFSSSRELSESCCLLNLNNLCNK